MNKRPVKQGMHAQLRKQTISIRIKITIFRQPTSRKSHVSQRPLRLLSAHFYRDPHVFSAFARG
ncbi:MAG: hypothetical protein KKG67_10515, partial [Gammaproteobacteria bacterium]|nr:hypothetical protein [Gammaproteobacteria bacterium]